MQDGVGRCSPESGQHPRSIPRGGTRSRSAARRDGGFTLVELLIVISILGIMATVTVFSVRGVTGRGQSRSCAADRKAMATAVETYFALNPGLLEIPPTGTDEDRYERTLLAAGLIRSLSGRHYVMADGRVVLQQTVDNGDGTRQAFCNPPPLPPAAP